MPNLAAAYGQSMTFVQSFHATQEKEQAVLDMFKSIGNAMLADDRQFKAGTALSGCGIAYAMRYIRAASEGGVELGFKADQAKEIVLQTLKGAVAVLEETGLHPEAAIDRVTTPGGLTIKGLNTMEANGFTTAVIEGLKASIK